jgi:hypothetical protein
MLRIFMMQICNRHKTKLLKEREEIKLREQRSDIILYSVEFPKATEPIGST